MHYYLLWPDDELEVQVLVAAGATVNSEDLA